MVHGYIGWRLQDSRHVWVCCLLSLALFALFLSLSLVYSLACSISRCPSVSHSLSPFLLLSICLSLFLSLSLCSLSQLTQSRTYTHKSFILHYLIHTYIHSHMHTYEQTRTFIENEYLQTHIHILHAITHTYGRVYRCIPSNGST